VDLYRSLLEGMISLAEDETPSVARLLDAGGVGVGVAILDPNCGIGRHAEHL